MNEISLLSLESMQVDGRKLTDIINKDHVNTKYLPGIQLPDNVFASSDIHEACSTADIIFFVVPHQFLGGNEEELLCPTFSMASMILQLVVIQKLMKRSH